MLKSNRILLRGIRRDDLPRLWEFTNDPEISVLGDAEPPIPRSLERMQAEYDQNAAKGGRDSTWFAIVVDDKVIGQCGLHSFDKFHGVSHSCELGIIIGDKNYWNHGYGREAVSLLLDYAFHYWNVHRVGLETSSANPRAIHCYAACGFVEEGRLRQAEWQQGEYVDTVLMGILREEWEQRQQGALPCK
jgi:RimJ/RimL family protein N-acetyltransferase